MDARLLPVGTVAAALAGATLAVVMVGGPLWLVVPGLLGAALPTVVARARGRRADGSHTRVPIRRRTSAGPS